MKSNDLHTSISLSVDMSKKKKISKKLKDLCMETGSQNHVVYILYPNRPVCTQEAQLSLTHLLIFRNYRVLVTYKLKNLNFTDHGQLVFIYWNFGQYVGLMLDDQFT